MFLRIIIICGMISLPLQLEAGKLKVTPIEDFDLSRYLGIWYEIARIENSFEEGLTNVTATYQLRKDGKISVTNKGFEVDDKEWDIAKSYGDFAESPNIGHIEVTFFWPFYVDYIVFEVGPEYEYAFVTSDSTDYLWLLAREPVVSQHIIERFLEVAKTNEFKIDDLVFVPQEMNIEKLQEKFKVAADESLKNSPQAEINYQKLVKREEKSHD